MEPSIQDQIVADIRRRIGRGSLKPGQRLPTKPQLIAQWRCSAQPVTMALARLAAEGLIVRFQGKGAFVADPLPQQPTRRTPTRPQQPSSRGSAHHAHRTDATEAAVPLQAIRDSPGAGPQARRRRAKGQP